MFHARWTIDQLTETSATVLVSASPDAVATAVVAAATEAVVEAGGGQPLELREGGGQAEAMGGNVRPARNVARRRALLDVEGAAQRDVWEEQPFTVDRRVLNELIVLRLTDSFRLAEVRPTETEAAPARLSAIEPVVIRVDPVVRAVREGDVYWVEHADAELYASLLRGEIAVEGVRVWDVTALARRQSKELFERVLVTEGAPARGR